MFSKYRLNLLTSCMICAAGLDVCTTCIFLAYKLGTEMNLVLAPLANHSLAWVPIYLLSRPLLVPFMPEPCKTSFATLFLIAGLTFGINNLSGITTGYFAVVQTIGMEPANATAVLISIGVFFLQLRKTLSTRRESVCSIVVFLLWIGIFLLMEVAYLLIGQLLQSGV
jgi:hypothetical protein